MKLYDNRVAPNPRRVRIFLAEKGMSVPTEEVDLGALAHQTEAYTAINPFQRAASSITFSPRSPMCFAICIPE
jgi:glutathione S-transferase